MMQEQRWYRGNYFVLCEQNKLARDVFYFRSPTYPQAENVKYFDQNKKSERKQNGKEFSEELQSERIRRPYL